MKCGNKTIISQASDINKQKKMYLRYPEEDISVLLLRINFILDFSSSFHLLKFYVQYDLSMKL